MTNLAMVHPADSSGVPRRPLRVSLHDKFGWGWSCRCRPAVLHLATGHQEALQRALRHCQVNTWYQGLRAHIRYRCALSGSEHYGLICSRHLDSLGKHRPADDGGCSECGSGTSYPCTSALRIARQYGWRTTL